MANRNLDPMTADSDRDYLDAIGHPADAHRPGTREPRGCRAPLPCECWTCDPREDDDVTF